MSGGVEGKSREAPPYPDCAAILRQVILRQPLPQARRQQQFFIRVVRTAAFARKTLCDYVVSNCQEKLRGHRFPGQAPGGARPGQSLSPHCRSQSTRFAERKSVIHASGRFCWVKVNGQWLYKTRQIVTGRNKHPARWMLWRPTRRARIPSALRSAKPQNPSAGIRPTIRVELSRVTRPSTLAGERSVT